MAKIVECIPNFSEGRNQAVIDGLAATAKSIPGVTLLDYSSDASHNRSVFTLVGDEESIQEVAFQLVKYASENIDMTKHEGEHPRMGATDVCPFVPVKDITTAECVEIANKVAERINRELGIPIFLYEDAATRPERTWRKCVKDNLKECQKNCWKKTGSQTTVNARFTQLQGLQLSVSGCHSLLSISTLIQTI